MVTMKPKELYLGNSVQDLNAMGEKLDKKTQPKIYLKSMLKIADAAREAEREGDEEKSYVLFMRYCSIFQLILRSREYAIHKAYYDSMLNRSAITDAMNRIEVLQKNLNRRFEERDARKLLAKREEERKKQESSAQVETISAPPRPVTPPSSQPPGWLLPITFAELLRSPKPPLVFDLRPLSLSEVAPLKAPSVIRLDPSVLPLSATVRHVTEALRTDPASLRLFEQRGEVAKVVLIDEESRPPLTGSMKRLKEAICEWDASQVLKTEPIAVEGGFADFFQFYPTMMSNAQKYREVLRERELKSKEKREVEINYPDLEERSRKKQEAEMEAQRKRQEAAMEEQRKRQEAEMEEQRKRQEAAMEAARVRRAEEKAQAEAERATMTSRLQAEKERNKEKQRRELNGAEAPPVMPDRSLKPAVNGAADGGPTRPKEQPEAGRKKVERRERTASPRDRKRTGASPKRSVANEPAGIVQDMKDLTMKDTKRDVAKDTTERVAKDTSERVAKDTKRDVAKDTTERVAKDTTERVAKDTTTRVAKDTSERVAKDTKEDVAKDTTERVAKDTTTRVAKDMTGRVAKDTTGRVAKDTKEDVALDSKGHISKDTKGGVAKETRGYPGLIPGAKAPGPAAADVKENFDKEEKGSARIPPVNRALKPGLTIQTNGSNNDDTLSGGAKSVANSSTSAGAYDPRPPAHPGSHMRVTKVPLKGDHWAMASGSGTSSASSGGRLKRSGSQPNLALASRDDTSSSASGTSSREHSVSGASSVASGGADGLPASRPPMPSREMKPRGIGESDLSSFDSETLRLMYPEYGATDRGLTGLRNLGNTCYMNSVLQALSSTPCLVQYVVSNLYRSDINRGNPAGHGGEIAEEFAILLKALWGGCYRIISPMKFKRTVGRHNSIFATNEQQDSQEFLLFLLDGLHEDFNQGKKRRGAPAPPALIEDESVPLPARAEEAWRWHKVFNSSFVVSFFQGQFKSTVSCLTCSMQSTTFDVFMYLSLQIPSNSRCTLKDCISQFSKEERMSGSSQWHCPRCRTSRDAEKRIEIWRLPPYLLIHLKRFSYDQYLRQKKNTLVEFPLEELVLSQEGGKSRSYDLYAVSNHYGSMESGHYTAYCLHSRLRSWYKFDDEAVSQLSASGVRTSAAYILFYATQDGGLGRDQWLS